jgi:hypothetical protein
MKKHSKKKEKFNMLTTPTASWFMTITYRSHTKKYYRSKKLLQPTKTTTQTKTRKINKVHNIFTSSITTLAMFVIEWIRQIFPHSSLLLITISLSHFILSSLSVTSLSASSFCHQHVIATSVFFSFSLQG